MKEFSEFNLTSYLSKDLKNLKHFSFCYECAHAVFNNDIILSWVPKLKNLFRTLDFISKDPSISTKITNKKIIKIVCNGKIVHAITDGGNVYSWGNDTDRYGTLGFGKIYCQEKPSLNGNLVNFYIKDISMSERHCCALDNYGRLYTWGYQQGFNSTEGTYNTDFPQEIKLEANITIKRIQCGNNYTAFVDSNNKLMYYGEIAYNTHQRYEVNEVHNVEVEDFACGKNLIVILDKTGNLFLYNEKQKLFTIKIKEKIKNIKLIDNIIYALTEDSGTLYEFKNKSNSTSFYDYIDTIYVTSLIDSNLKLLNTAFYNKLLFFTLDSKHKFNFENNYDNKKRAIITEHLINKPENIRTFHEYKIRSKSTCTKEFVLPHNEVNKRKRRENSFLDYHTLSVIDNSVLGSDNDNFLRTAVDEQTIKSIRKNRNNDRISRISNLFGKIFDHKFEQIETNLRPKSRCNNTTITSRKDSYDQVNSAIMKTTIQQAEFNTISSTGKSAIPEKIKNLMQIIQTPSCEPTETFTVKENLITFNNNNNEMEEDSIDKINNESYMFNSNLKSVIIEDIMPNFDLNLNSEYIEDTFDEPVKDCDGDNTKVNTGTNVKSNHETSKSFKSESIVNYIDEANANGNKTTPPKVFFKENIDKVNVNEFQLVINNTSKCTGNINQMTIEKIEINIESTKHMEKSNDNSNNVSEINNTIRLLKDEVQAKNLDEEDVKSNTNMNYSDNNLIDSLNENFKRKDIKFNEDKLVVCNTNDTRFDIIKLDNAGNKKEEPVPIGIENTETLLTSLEELTKPSNLATLDFVAIKAYKKPKIRAITVKDDERTSHSLNFGRQPKKETISKDKANNVPKRKVNKRNSFIINNNALLHINDPVVTKAEEDESCHFINFDGSDTESDYCSVNSDNLILMSFKGESGFSEFKSGVPVDLFDKTRYTNTNKSVECGANELFKEQTANIKIESNNYNTIQQDMNMNTLANIDDHVKEKIIKDLEALKLNNVKEKLNLQNRNYNDFVTKSPAKIAIKQNVPDVLKSEKFAEYEPMELDNSTLRSVSINMSSNRKITPGSNSSNPKNTNQSLNVANFNPYMTTENNESKGLNESLVNIEITEIKESFDNKEHENKYKKFEDNFKNVQAIKKVEINLDSKEVKKPINLNLVQKSKNYIPIPTSINKNKTVKKADLPPKGNAVLQQYPNYTNLNKDKKMERSRSNTAIKTVKRETSIGKKSTIDKLTEEKRVKVDMKNVIKSIKNNNNNK